VAESGKGARFFQIGTPVFPRKAVGVRFELKSFEYYEADRSNINLLDNAPL
jgi:hypothetical protein